VDIATAKIVFKLSLLKHQIKNLKSFAQKMVKVCKLLIIMLIYSQKI